MDQNDVMEDAEHVANTVEMEKRKTTKKIARRKTLMKLLEIPRRDTEEHTQLQGSTRAKKRKSRPNSRDEHLEKTKKSIANRGQETDGSEGVICFLNAVRHIGVPETIRAWDAQQAQREEHRLRDPVHLLAERNGASDRSRVQAGRSWILHRSHSLPTRSAMVDWPRDAGSCCGGEPNAADWWVKSISDVTGSGVVSTTVQFSSDVFQ